MIKDHTITIGPWNVHISGVGYFPYHPLHHILGQEEVVFVTNHPEAQGRGFRVKPQSTPYNTYVIRGLPSGPFAFQGEEAIQAALFPAKTDFLYFVSKNDGSHHFSRTLSEHSRAVTA